MYFLSTSSPPQFPCIIISRSSPPSNHTHHHIRHHNFLHQIPQPSHRRNHPDHHNYKHHRIQSVSIHPGEIELTRTLPARLTANA